jgi:4'-phosphopantetheinyl transferase
MEQMGIFKRIWQSIPLTTDWLPPEPIGASIHVWQVRFSEWRPREALFAATLSPEEGYRAQQFRDPALASRYVIGRGLLRALLTKYVGSAAEVIEISTNAYGKPELGKELQFNLAHAGDMALYAFTNGRPIGVDVELVEHVSPSPLEARRILANSEWEVWQHLSDQDRTLLFYQTWVRKEAVLKALGVGLAIEPDTFSVGLRSHPEVALVQGTTVRIRDLPMPAPIKAAVASTGAEMPDVRCYLAEAAG